MNQAPTLSLTVAPAKVTRGSEALTQAGEAIATLGKRPLGCGGEHPCRQPTRWQQVLEQQQLQLDIANYGNDCSEPVWQDCDRQRQHIKLI